MWPSTAATRWTTAWSLTQPTAAQVHVAVDNGDTMDDCLAALRSLPQLSVLALTVASFVLDERQMAALGDLPLSDLRLVSHVRTPFAPF